MHIQEILKVNEDGYSLVIEFRRSALRWCATFFGVVNVNPTLMGMIDRMCNPCDMQMGFNGGVMWATKMAGTFIDLYQPYLWWGPMRTNGGKTLPKQQNGVDDGPPTRNAVTTSCHKEFALGLRLQHHLELLPSGTSTLPWKITH